MPYDATLVQAFLEEFSKYIEFQSTLEVLKRPPDTYASPSVDIRGGLKKISDTDYDSQYDFDDAISPLLSSAHDGHLNTNLYSLQSFFFQLDSQGLVSVSEDAEKLPKSTSLKIWLLARRARMCLPLRRSTAKMLETS